MSIEEIFNCFGSSLGVSADVISVVAGFSGKSCAAAESSKGFVSSSVAASSVAPFGVIFD